MKVRRHHPDDGVDFAVNGDLLAHYAGFTTKPALPQSVTKNNDVVSSWLILVWIESAAECWTNTQHLKHLSC